MSFSIQIKAKDKADAKALAHESREAQRPNFPHPVLDFIEHAINSIPDDGPITITGSGHLGGHFSDLKLSIGTTPKGKKE